MTGRLTLAAALAALALTPAASSAQGVDQTCELALARTDAATVNIAFPDEAAVYYLGNYQAAPGTRIRISGDFPYSRYMSFNVYDSANRPLDALADVQLTADLGAPNPFVAGAARESSPRHYNAFIDFGAVPQRRAPNTLYSGTGQNGLPNLSGTFIYRIYIPDDGRDLSGGTGIPTVTLESSDGSPAPPSACSGFQKPSVPGVNDQVAASNGLPATSPDETSGTNPPTWHKFFNLPIAFADATLENPYADQGRLAADQLPLDRLGGSGGFLSNIHNSYLYTGTNSGRGQVVVTRMRAPTFPDTRQGTAAMPAGQVRYFSLCQNEFFSQRFIACRTDDQTAVDDDGFMTYVVSTPAERPANARAECGVTWIPRGPSQEGALIYRHMLPDPVFGQAIQRIATRQQEQTTMGDYFPQSRYYADKQAFEATGCRIRSSAPYLSAKLRLRLAVSPSHVRAGERRRFAFRVTSGGRRIAGATVRFAGHSARTDAGGRAAMPLALRSRGIHRAVASRTGFARGLARVAARRAASRARFAG